MIQLEVKDESIESTLSIREQLLLTQAVHQVQSNKSEANTIDWTQVTGLLQEFLKSNKIEGLDFTFDDHTVCCNVYAKLCQTYLEDQNQQSLDGPQTLIITRQIYATYIKSIAEALQEEENKCKKIQSEIEAISRGEWDANLQAEDAQSNQQLQISSEPDSSSSKPLETDGKPLSDPPTATLMNDSILPTVHTRTTARKFTNLEDRRATSITKEVQEEKPSTSENPSNNEKQTTRGRKRKAPDTTKKVEKPPAEEPDKEASKRSSSRSRAPKKSKRSGSDDDDNEDDDDDDDDAAVEKLITAGGESSTTTKKSLRLRQNRSTKREQSVPSDSKKDSSHFSLPQSKRARLDKEDDVQSREDPKIPEKSPASPSHEEEKRTAIQEKSEENKLPTANESPTDGTLGGEKMTEESHSTAHSPSSTRKLTLENEVSADGSLVGTPNSATFGTSTTEGNLTANQTPNSAKLGLWPVTAEASTTNTVKGAGTSSTNNTGTTNDSTSFRRRMLKTHSSVQSNPISSIFRDPVKESEAAGYYSIIKRPMDLRTLAKKLRDGKVVSTEEYRRELMLMLANAVMFNHEDSEVTRHAKELMVECDRLVSIFMRGSRY